MIKKLGLGRYLLLLAMVVIFVMFSFNVAAAKSFIVQNASNSTLFKINGSNGFVGIATNAPTTALDVTGTVTATAFSGDGSSLTGLVLQTNVSLVQAGNTTFVTSQSVGGDVSGTVGSITINPNFVVNTNASFVTQIINDTYPTLDIDNTDDGGNVNGSDINVSSIVVNNTFFVNGSRVGIGTSAPGASLDVSGTGNFSGTLQANLFVGDGSSLTGLVLQTNESLVQAGNTTYVTSQSVGGDVSGTVGSITINPNFVINTNISFVTQAVNDTFPTLDTDSSDDYNEVNLSDDLSNGIAATISTTTFTADTITVNKNLYVIGNISNVAVSHLNMNGSLFPAITNVFDLGNGSLQWRGANFSGTVEAGSLSDGTALITGGVITGASLSADQITAGALDIGANAFTVNSIEIVGADGEVNDAAIESTIARDSEVVLRTNVSLVQAGNITFVTSQSVGGDASGTVGAITIDPNLWFNATIVRNTNASFVTQIINDTYPTLDIDNTDDGGSGGWNSTATTVFLNVTTANVGIGVATPEKKLVVNGTTNAVTFDPSAEIPAINTTGQGLLLTSSTGDVIITI